MVADMPSVLGLQDIEELTVNSLVNLIVPFETEGRRKGENGEPYVGNRSLMHY